MRTRQEFYAYYKILPTLDMKRQLALIKWQVLPVFQDRRIQVQQFDAGTLEALQQARAEREAL